MVLLCGPSCAGKTTTAKLLKQILELKGRVVDVISLEKFKVYCKEDNNDSCEIFTSLKEAEEKAAELNKNSNKTYVIESFFENEGF